MARSKVCSLHTQGFPRVQNKFWRFGLSTLDKGLRLVLNCGGGGFKRLALSWGEGGIHSFVRMQYAPDVKPSQARTEKVLVAGNQTSEDPITRLPALSLADSILVLS